MPKGKTKVITNFFCSDQKIIAEVDTLWKLIVENNHIGDIVSTRNFSDEHNTKIQKVLNIPFIDLINLRKIICHKFNEEGLPKKSELHKKLERIIKIILSIILSNSETKENFDFNKNFRIEGTPEHTIDELIRIFSKGIIEPNDEKKLKQLIQSAENLAGNQYGQQIRSELEKLRSIHTEYCKIVQTHNKTIEKLASVPQVKKNQFAFRFGFITIESLFNKNWISKILGICPHKTLISTFNAALITTTRKFKHNDSYNEKILNIQPYLAPDGSYYFKEEYLPYLYLAFTITRSLADLDSKDERKLTAQLPKFLEEVIQITLEIVSNVPSEQQANLKSINGSYKLVLLEKTPTIKRAELKKTSSDSNPQPKNKIYIKSRSFGQLTAAQQTTIVEIEVQYGLIGLYLLLHNELNTQKISIKDQISDEKNLDKFLRFTRCLDDLIRINNLLQHHDDFVPIYINGILNNEILLSKCLTIHGDLEKFALEFQTHLITLESKLFSKNNKNSNFENNVLAHYFHHINCISEVIAIFPHRKQNLFDYIQQHISIISQCIQSHDDLVCLINTLDLSKFNNKQLLMLVMHDPIAFRKCTYDQESWIKFKNLCEENLISLDEISQICNENIYLSQFHKNEISNNDIEALISSDEKLSKYLLTIQDLKHLAQIIPTYKDQLCNKIISSKSLCTMLVKTMTNFSDIISVFPQQEKEIKNKFISEHTDILETIMIDELQRNTMISAFPEYKMCFDIIYFIKQYCLQHSCSEENKNELNNALFDLASNDLTSTNKKIIHSMLKSLYVSENTEISTAWLLFIDKKLIRLFSEQTLKYTFLKETFHHNQNAINRTSSL